MKDTCLLFTPTISSGDPPTNTLITVSIYQTEYTTVLYPIRECVCVCVCVCVRAQADWWLTALQERQINKGGFPSVPADWTKSLRLIGAFSQFPPHHQTLLSVSPFTPEPLNAFYPVSIQCHICFFTIRDVLRKQPCVFWGYTHLGRISLRISNEASPGSCW